ncbi:unnamed protein product [Merluccius merluccius]
MRSLLLKLLVLLVCVRRGDGLTLPALLGGDPASQDHRRAGGPLRPPRGDVLPSPPPPRRSRRSRRSAPDAAVSACGLRSVLLRVRDLGLGYDSDETVLFKYCGGACERVRSNHDLTLASLLLSGVLPPPPGRHGELPWSGGGGPCCRPTHHEDLAFLDNTHRWHKVEKLLAAGCSCVG